MDDLESLEETVDVLSSPALIEQIRKSLEALETEPATILSKDDALALMRPA
jgi:PHD/YefM family antitoxin component YafN of YafNO toxin-antitoxin module